jgi:glycosyltransferase involved in cell wall biosynthesis
LETAYELSRPEVSVVIPAYNAESYVGSALDSVFAQTFRDFEVLVVDDGSIDGTAKVVSEYGATVRYIRQANAGVSQARNQGIEASAGRYVAFLDADDTWFPEKLDRQLAHLSRSPQHKACYSALAVVTADMRPIKLSRSKRSGSLLEDLILRGNVIGSGSTVLCERSLFAAVGGFDPALSQCADWDMWIRLATRTDFLYVDEPLVTYRQHASSMSRNAPLYEHDVRLLLDKAFAMPLSTPVRARRSEGWGRAYMVLAGTYFHAGLYSDFLRCVVRAAWFNPRQTAYLVRYPLRWFARARSHPIDRAP